MISAPTPWYLEQDAETDVYKGNSLSAFLQINVGDETGKWHHCCSASLSVNFNLIADGSRSQRKQHIHITISGTRQRRCLKDCHASDVYASVSKKNQKSGGNLRK